MAFLDTAVGNIEGLTTGTWAIDTSHSSVEFQTRHLMVSKVKGRFPQFEGSITIGDTPVTSKVDATVQLSSVDTRDEKRDEHLRSADFLDVEQFPTMTYVSREVRAAEHGRYLVVGDLSLHGVTRPVELSLEANGVSTDPWGGIRAGFSARAEINRRDFGLEWNVSLDSGGVLVGEVIKIELEIEAVKQ